MDFFLEFVSKFPNENACIEALAQLKWVNGFVCDRRENPKAYHHRARPRIYECTEYGHQHSVTVGTTFHKTRTPLMKWFYAAYLISHDKRGVSALFVSRELELRYETACLMCHKLRHCMTERDEFLLDDYVEVDETFYGGRRQKGQQGRSRAPGKSLIVAAVEKVLVQRRGQSEWVGGSARIAVLPDATIGAFIGDNVKKSTWILTDGFKSYRNLDGYRHTPIVQGAGENAKTNMPLILRIFSNIKAWLSGTHHGVSAKHLPRYFREWSYRFNRRQRIDGLADYVLRRCKLSRATARL